MERARPIYTDDMNKRVIARVEELIKQASQIWPEHAQKFEMPVIRYDLKGRVGGTAQTPPAGVGRPIVRLNLIMFYENEEHFLKQTVGHEMAHVFCDRINGRTKKVTTKDGEIKTKKIMPHGKEWFDVMQKLGLELKKYHTYQLKSIHSAPRGGKTPVEKLKQIGKRIKNIKSNWQKLPADVRAELLEWAQDFQDAPETEDA